MKSSIARFSFAGAAWLSSLSAVAHHGPWMYDFEKIETFRGVVTEVRWNNPHVEISIEGADESGNRVLWRLESAPPFKYEQTGLAPSDLGLNSEVVYTGYPSRNPGVFVAYARSVQVSNGEVVELPELGTFRRSP